MAPVTLISNFGDEIVNVCSVLPFSCRVTVSGPGDALIVLTSKRNGSNAFTSILPPVAVLVAPLPPPPPPQAARRSPDASRAASGTRLLQRRDIVGLLERRPRTDSREELSCGHVDEPASGDVRRADIR